MIDDWLTWMLTDWSNSAISLIDWFMFSLVLTDSMSFTINIFDLVSFFKCTYINMIKVSDHGTMGKDNYHWYYMIMDVTYHTLGILIPTVTINIILQSSGHMLLFLGYNQHWWQKSW